MLEQSCNNCGGHAVRVTTKMQNILGRCRGYLCLCLPAPPILLIIKASLLLLWLEYSSLLPTHWHPTCSFSPRAMPKAFPGSSIVKRSKITKGESLWERAGKFLIRFNMHLPHHLLLFGHKVSGRGCPFLLQIFLIQGLHPGLPHYRQTLYCLSHQGSPVSDTKEHSISSTYLKL